MREVAAVGESARQRAREQRYRGRRIGDHRRQSGHNHDRKTDKRAATGNRIHRSGQQSGNGKQGDVIAYDHRLRSPSVTPQQVIVRARSKRLYDIAAAPGWTKSAKLPRQHAPQRRIAQDEVVEQRRRGMCAGDYQDRIRSQRMPVADEVHQRAVSRIVRRHAEQVEDQRCSALYDTLCDAKSHGERSATRRATNA